MTKNQKIAAGCGGLGCLGLIVLAIAGTVGYYLMRPVGAPARSYNFNSNSNSNNNRNTNQNTSEPTNSSSANSSSGNNSSYTDDDKHKLFQAASMTGDAELMQKVVKKLGLFTATGIPKDDYPQFIKDHMTWGAANGDFIASLDTPEKARAYIDAHL